MVRRRLTKHQKTWLKEYENRFLGMDAMYVDDYRSGEITWEEMCQRNYDWLENWLFEGIRALERLGSSNAFEAQLLPLVN